MSQQHPGPGVSHDRFGLCPLRRLVAVHGTVRASRFVIPIRALLQPYFGVVQEPPTFVTKGVADGAVVIGAINPDHPGHGQPFTRQVFFFKLHVELLLQAQINEEPCTLDVLGRDITAFPKVGIKIAASPAGKVNLTFAKPGCVEVAERDD